MKELRTEIQIKATPEKIWSVLTDFRKYPEWNPMIKLFDGKLIEGEKVTVKLQQPGSSAMIFKPTIKLVISNKTFRWQGHLLVPGLFDGEHIFEIADNKDGTSNFIHRENFKGILIPLFKKMIEVNTKQGFQSMNEELKKRCEAGV